MDIFSFYLLTPEDNTRKFWVFFIFLSLKTTHGCFCSIYLKLKTAHGWFIFHFLKPEDNIWMLFLSIYVRLKSTHGWFSFFPFT